MKMVQQQQIKWSFCKKKHREYGTQIETTVKWKLWKLHDYERIRRKTFDLGSENIQILIGLFLFKSP